MIFAYEVGAYLDGRLDEEECRVAIEHWCLGGFHHEVTQLEIDRFLALLRDDVEDGFEVNPNTRSSARYVKMFPVEVERDP